jgi:DNA repair protein RecO (recombination protein O)
VTRRRIEQEPAYVLHCYPYKESSLIVEAFARHRGRVGLLARGARRARSSVRGLLLAFHPLRLSWSAGAELGTLSGVEWSGGHRALAGVALMCGFYVNELLLRLLPREDAHEMLYDAYGATLARLADGEDPAALLRGFELRLLRELGYAPPLEHVAGSGARVEAGKRYVYAPERGPLELTEEGRQGLADELTVSGQTLLDMSQDEFERPETREESRRLMRHLIGARLAGQALHTSAILRELQDL